MPYGITFLTSQIEETTAIIYVANGKSQMANSAVRRPADNKRFAIGDKRFWNLFAENLLPVDSLGDGQIWLVQKAHKESWPAIRLAHQLL